jgi:hypothetical protein
MKNVTTKVDKLPELKKRLALLARHAVYVGVPSDGDAGEGSNERDDDSKEPMNNATLAYIHDNGAPASGIPARPFMKPGIEASKDFVSGKIKAAMKSLLKTGDEEALDSGLERVGMYAANSIKGIIRAGIQPALKPSTVLTRYRKRKTQKLRAGEKAYQAEFKRLLAKGTDEEQAAAEAQALTGITPLVDTGQLLNSITYVLKRDQ